MGIYKKKKTQQILSIHQIDLLFFVQEIRRILYVTAVIFTSHLSLVARDFYVKGKNKNQNKKLPFFFFFVSLSFFLALPSFNLYVKKKEKEKEKESNVYSATS